jgi:transposase
MKTGRPRIKVSTSEAVKDEIAARIGREGNALMRDRLRAIQMTFDGTRRYEDIARQLGRARSSVQLWVEAFTAEGLQGLLRWRKAPGKASAMQNPQVQADVVAGLREGRWRTGPQFADWIRQGHGIELCSTQTYYWLKKAGAALKVPRPVHTKKDEAAAAAFKEGLFDALCRLELPAGSRVKVWVTDEARIGLHDASRRCWSLRGVRVVKPRQQEYEWCYVYGALEVVEGRSEFQLLPTVGLPLTHGFLEQLVASDPQAFHVVIGDQAGFHFRPDDSRLPPRVRIVPLPAYSPELNPVERLWDLIKDALCNRVYKGIQALEDAASVALGPFIANPQRVRSLVGDGWMHVQANAMCTNFIPTV